MLFQIQLALRYNTVKIGARIPDVRPGEQTIKHLGELQDGSRFFGGLLLGTVAVSCTMMDNYMVWAFLCDSFFFQRSSVN